MRYFTEMSSKFGFEDGSAIPPDAESCRLVYCRVLNKILERLSSSYRIVPFNRGGAHNWCLWVRVSLLAYVNMTVEQRESGEMDFGDDYTVQDEYLAVAEEQKWQKAISIAKEVPWDDCVETTVTINDEMLRDNMTWISERLEN